MSLGDYLESLENRLSEKVLTNLVLLVEQFQLVVNKAVLGALFFSQCPLLLQLRAPEGFNAMHAGAEFLVGQFQFFLKVSQFPLKIGILRLQLSKEEGGRLASVVLLLGGRRRSVRAVIVALEGLVAERTRARAVVSAGRGRAASLVGRRRGLVISREVGAAAGRAAVHLRQAAARAAAAAGPILPAPLLPARRPLVLRGVLAEIQLGSFPASVGTHCALDCATDTRPLNGTPAASIALRLRMRGRRTTKRLERYRLIPGRCLSRGGIEGGRDTCL